MTIQLSTAVRNALLDSIETAVGASPVLKIRTGAAPASPAAADSGTVVATIALPADWMANASGGTKAMQGTWADDAADASGTAAHYRIYAADGTTCHLQGTVTATGGGGDMTVDNTNFAAGQKFSVTGYTLTAPNA
ncbi:hypothetical protein [Sphingomonas sp. CV7422]|uniref:hypothetical protein n=1 Tax=Sphingomonas sp. CV7422 TaxID=3018036 RepID=UPI0022FEF406|nr:hypothetical protein [Sphingomonas sp. CV7422]